jgi:hypothetical protein
MIVNIVMALAVLIAVSALIISIKALRLQKNSLQADLFNDISSRIRELEDQWEDCDTKEKKQNWYQRLFNAFEYFALFANQGTLSKKMRHYYKSGIKTYVERLKENQYSELLEAYSKRPKEQFSELREYYKNEIGKDLPF